MGVREHAYPYSLWGVITPLADTQFVRVFPVDLLLDRGTPEPLDARFVSVNLETGEERLWRDSVFVDTSGVVAHVFYAPFQAVYGHRYQLTITGSDERSSSVEVHVPERTTLALHPPDTTRGVVLSGIIEGESPHLVRAEVEYAVKYVIGFTPPPLSSPIYRAIRFKIPYEDRLRQTSSGWRVQLDLNEDYATVRTAITLDDDFIASQGITLLLITFQAVVASEEWSPPGGVFDPLVLMQPGTMENVENGFGFVTGGYRLGRSWTLPVEVVEKTPFVPNR